MMIDCRKDCTLLEARAVFSKEVWGWHDCSPKHHQLLNKPQKVNSVPFLTFAPPFLLSHCPSPCVIKSISWLLYKYGGREGEGQQELAGLPSAPLMNRRSGTFSIRLCCTMPPLSGVSPASQSWYSIFSFFHFLSLFCFFFTWTQI